MVTKEEFINLITEYVNWVDLADKTEEILNIFIYDNKLIEYVPETFIKVMKILFTPEGVEEIDWWIHEKYWDEDSDPLEKTPEYLWNLVKDFQK